MTNIFDCVGWNPPPRLLRALRERGFADPWEMTPGEFRDLKDALTLAEGRSEIDRIARALHADGDIPDAMRRYARDFAHENPRLVERLGGVKAGDGVTLWRAVAATDPNPIRPGDWVALERGYAASHGAARSDYAGGSKIVKAMAKAGDVAWAGTSADEWIYAPRACRAPEMTVHEFLVRGALARGLQVPPRAAAGYGGGGAGLSGRGGLQARDAGAVPFDEIPGEARDDVVASVSRLTGEDPGDVEVGLANGPAEIPLVVVDPAEVLRVNDCPGLKFSPRTVADYARRWRAGEAAMPVVVDSSSRGRCGTLLEGRHRTVSAARAGIREIEAFDVAGPRVVRTKEGLETYDFARTRAGG